MDNENLDEYAQLAHTLVDAAIDKALNVLRTKCSETDMATYRSEAEKFRKVEIDYSGLSSDVPNIQWPKIDEFSPEKGEEKIHEFIKTCFYEDNWLYSTKLIRADELEFDTRYRYTVQCSIPSLSHPVPRASASIYFTIEVSKILPEAFPISVYYVVEGEKLVHRPGQTRFEEKWLKDVIENKILVLEKDTETDRAPAAKRLKINECEILGEDDVDGELQARWQSEDYQNYLKINQALLFLRDGLASLCIQMFSEFQSEILRSNNFVPMECTNKLCCSKNIKNGKLNSPCMVCSTIPGTILREHRSGKDPKAVYWTNSQIQKWSTDPWELAKLFMGRGQKAENHGPFESDPASVLQLLNNCKLFWKLVPCKKVEELLHLRNAVVHSSTLAVGCDEMQQGFNLVIDFLHGLNEKLSAEKRFELIVNSIEEAVEKLKKLRNTKINIFLQTSEKLLEQEVDIFRAIISSHGDCLNALQEPMEKVEHVKTVIPLLEMINKNQDLLANLENGYDSLVALVASTITSADQETISHVDKDINNLQKKIRGLTAKVSKTSEGPRYKLELRNLIATKINTVRPRYLSWLDPLNTGKWLARVSIVAGSKVHAFVSPQSAQTIMKAEHSAAAQALDFLRTCDITTAFDRITGENAKDKLHKLLQYFGFSEPNYIVYNTEPKNDSVTTISASASMIVTGIIHEKLGIGVNKRERQESVARKALESLNQKVEGCPTTMLSFWCQRNKYSVPIYFPKRKADKTTYIVVTSTAFEGKHEVIVEGKCHVSKEDAELSAAEVLLKIISATQLTEIWCSICHSNE